ncbi:glycosyltransferase [Hydrogenophilus thiooxidans]|uniref:glycosyltransferase n=1 Tax=Hydrogenophilus thiooxidans TaxID=2820326 RepID=UPI001C24666D|nr:glycosyltransferase [Hydrogenophilus thiooxidans]
MTVTVSIVSHGHHSLLPPLLSDIADCPEVEHLILTLNRPEPIPTLPQPLAHRTTLILNSTPKGFGANHNAAFAHCRTPYFAILNPDLRLPHNPFPTLLATLANSGAAIASPSILNPSGAIEDHARHFPTVKSLLRKLFRQSDDRYRYTFHTPPFPPQWLAGIFLLVRHDAFAALKDTLNKSAFDWK